MIPKYSLSYSYDVTCDAKFRITVPSRMVYVIMESMTGIKGVDPRMLKCVDSLYFRHFGDLVLPDFRRLLFYPLYVYDQIYDQKFAEIERSGGDDEAIVSAEMVSAVVACSIAVRKSWRRVGSAPSM